MPSPKRTTAADGPCPPRAPDQAVILVNLPDFTPSIKRTRPKTGEPSPVSGRDRPEQPGAQNAGHRRFDLRHPCSGGPRVRILLPPAESLSLAPLSYVMSSLRSVSHTHHPEVVKTMQEITRLIRPSWSRPIWRYRRRSPAPTSLRPRRVAELIAATARVAVTPLPIDFALTVSMAWHRRAATDPAQSWFRSLLIEAAAA
jgi:hypothetical protein